MEKHAELVDKVKKDFEWWGFIMYKERLVPTKGFGLARVLGFDLERVVREIAITGTTDYLVRVDLIGYF